MLTTFKNCGAEPLTSIKSHPASEKPVTDHAIYLIELPDSDHANLAARRIGDINDCIDFDIVQKFPVIIKTTETGEFVTQRIINAPVGSAK